LCYCQCAGTTAIRPVTETTVTQGKYTNNKQQMKKQWKKIIRGSHLKNKIIDSIIIVKKKFVERDYNNNMCKNSSWHLHDQNVGYKLEVFCVL
jgi:hypothetical protein